MIPKANNDDLIKYESFKEKEEKAFKIFQEKVEVHNLDMKLIATHYLLEEQKVILKTIIASYPVTGQPYSVPATSDGCV